MSNSQRFSCAILGEQSLVIPCAEALQQGGHEIRALVTNAVTIKEWAAEHGVLVVAGAEAIADHPVDYIFSIANPAALTPEEKSMLSQTHGPVDLEDFVGLIKSLSD